MKQLSKIFLILIADLSVLAATDSAVIQAGNELRAGMVKREPEITVVVDNGNLNPAKHIM